MDIAKRKMHNGARYMSFTLDNENYCLDILNVKELMGITTITPLPRTPSFIRGVINLRGQIIPIIDLRLRFELPFEEYTKRTAIIVVEVPYESEKILMGLVVDSLQDVISIPADKLAKIPYVNTKVNSDYIKGVANTEEGMKIVLDIIKILNSDEIADAIDKVV
jgi:purine-binding chemotaxis protein CheW